MEVGSEFEDEAPGSYLSELGTRSGSVVWGGLNLLLIFALRLAAWLGRIEPSSEWYTLFRLLWSLLPVSCLLLLIVTMWQVGTVYTEKPPTKVLLSLLFSLTGLVFWLYFALVLDILPGLILRTILESKRGS